MLGTKTTLIADLLYGSIGLAPLEKRLISTRAFNRLHNVLQNSTVYFTYPSNRTSRFSHSLGVAKIAGELFRSSLLNASQEVAKTFFDLAKKEIETRCQKPDFLKSKSILSEQFLPEDETLSAANSLGCHFYESMLVPGLDKEQTGIYIVLLQSVRFAALMHDLGHPPFSHVAEFALQNIYEGLKDQETQPGEASDSKRKVLVQMVEFLALDDEAVFHEIVGIKVSEALLESLLRELDSEKCGDAQKYAMMLIMDVTMAILSDAGFFSILHKLIASDLDADRLDYVQRDLVTSGISREPFRPDRLFQSFTLIRDEQSEEEPFRFIPSIRGLNNLEDFFTQRFQLYKYVIYHHRVVKFDGLMQRCIEDLSDKYHKETVGGVGGKKLSPSAVGADGLVLASNISGLWQIFSQQVMSRPAQRESFYIQWDDAWLLNELRREYFQIRKERDESERSKDVPNSKAIKNSKSVLEIRLEELLSNRKHYHALFKRTECFLKVDHAFANAAPNDFDWTDMGKNWDLDDVSCTRVKHESELIKKYVTELKTSGGNDQKITSLVENNGYLVTRTARF